MPETAAFCPGCGISMKEPVRAAGKVGPLRENLAGVLAYFTFIPAVVFLLVRPYNKNVFVRFHSMQCLLLWGAALLTATLIRVAGFVLVLIPIVGPLLLVLIAVFGALGALSLWVISVVKAFRGEAWKLPAAGHFAENFAASL